MNRSLKLSMLIALALGSSQVLAIDYGQIQVKSALGQPLLAEIPLHPDNPAELKGLTIQLASSEDFARAGIVGGRTSVPLRFSVAKAGTGQSVIRITSSVPVNDPFLDLLIEINGKDGKSVREYAVLLDPPGSQPVAPVATTPVASQPAQRPRAPTPAQPVAAPAPKPAATQPVNGEYGPVQSGQTLSGIARSVAPAGIDAQQMMLALQQANPNAFYRDNINALKSGAVLRVPTSAEAQAMTLAAAAAEVRRQNSDWRAGVPGTPTVVADAATRGSGAAPSSDASDHGDRLALVPAKEGSSTGTQGNGAADKSSASLRQDLLRTQESLVSLQQQSTDLKERLKDLSDINGKNERLLTLKDNEIAELQNKLAAARKVAGLPPAAAVENTQPETDTAAATQAPPSMEVATASTAGAPATPATATTTAMAALPAAAASVPVSDASVAVAPVAASTPAKAEPAPKPVTKLPPAPVEQPWYMQTWAWAAGGGAIVLLILLGMLGRRRKSGTGATTSKSSLADRFGAAPVATDEDILADEVDQNQLLDQLAEHPDDIDLHLELVSLYYARRDVEHFEAGAEAMYAHISDPQQDEWQDVVHMGEDLAPSHPLFDKHGSTVESHDEDARGTFDIDDYADPDDAPTVVSPVLPPSSSTPKKVSEYNFNFDLTHPGDESASAPVSDIDVASDDVTVVAPLAAGEPAAPVEPESTWQFDSTDSPHAPLNETPELADFSDDPVDTKLDLARAYIDMGDAEGARAMLAEVSTEGTQMQRDTAQRLLDSLA